MKKYCYKLIVEYDGTDFYGWQIQPRERTVQQEIKEAIEKFTRQKIKLEGAGRTDTGVHALGQVAAFTTENYFKPADLLYRLNRILPDDVVIKKVSSIRPDFDPRRDAISRTYHYQIAETPQALSRHGCLQLYHRLDLTILNEAAEIYIGRHDFSAFCRQKSLKDNNHCQIEKSRWFRRNGMLVYEVKADRFLHHMVRRMVGAMLAVEEAKLSLTQLKTFLNNKSDFKTHSGIRFSVLARGLVLVEVKYGRKQK